MSTPAPTNEPPSTNVFIGWSGPRSRDLAQALRDWLPLVLQASHPWMSDRDIGPGERWGRVLGEQLKTSRIAILCLCQGNQNAASMHYEAGIVLGAFEDDARVIPYCLDIDSKDLRWPFNDFHAKGTSKADTRDLVMAINALMRPSLPAADAGTVFDMWWPKLQEKIEKIPSPPSGTAPPRPERELLEEILDRVRAIGLQQGPWEPEDADSYLDYLSSLPPHLVQQIDPARRNVLNTTGSGAKGSRRSPFKVNVPVREDDGDLP